MGCRAGKYTVCSRVRVSFSPEILQAGAVKGLMFVALFATQAVQTFLVSLVHTGLRRAPTTIDLPNKS